VHVRKMEGLSESGFSCLDGGGGALLGGGGLDEGEDCGDVCEEGGADCGCGLHFGKWFGDG